MMQTQLIPSADGAILIDAACAAQADGVAPQWFEPAFWRARGALDETQGGRGGVGYIDAPCGRSVLRHYRRGGMVARVMGDRYLWTGAERTRGFVEFRLLAQLHARGLPVPAPVAARYRRDGVHYRADLITRRIAHASTLAELLALGQCDSATATRVGTVLGEFHDAGVYHADLNAHNILLDANAVWLIDFDRGQLRAPERSWQLANLARLRRSLIKLGASRDGETAFERSLWTPLMAAWEARVSATSPARRSHA